jgi:hypothetical protein
LHYSKVSLFFAGSFAVIAKYDPDTFHAMQATEWKLRGNSAVCGQIDALAATNPDGNPPYTYVDSSGIIRESRRIGIRHWQYLAGSILVHEYAHLSQKGIKGDPLWAERPAYEAQITFARKLPRDIAVPIANYCVLTYRGLAGRQ